MVLKEVRIDDRLVHGQIVTAWVQGVGAQAILVADDKAAEDVFQQTILKMAAPEGVQLIIKSLADAAALIRRDQSEVGVLLIVRDTSDARKLLELGVEAGKITLGNITNKRSDSERRMVLKFVFASQEDANNLLAISQMGVELVAQTVPSDKTYDIMNLLKKSGFFDQNE